MYIKVDSAKCQTKGAESSVNESGESVPVILFLELGECVVLVSDDDFHVVTWS